MQRPETWDDALRILTKPVPKKFVKEKPGSKAEYVPHTIARQMLHAVFADHSFRTIQVREYDVERKTKKGPKTERHVAMQVALYVRLGDEWRCYEGWGESENSTAPYKSAESDAVKRIVAMHLGYALHLWSREHTFLHRVLNEQADVQEAVEEAAEQDADPVEDESPELEESKVDPDAAAELVKDELGAEEVEDDGFPEPDGVTPEDLHVLKREHGISSKKWREALERRYGVERTADLTAEQRADLAAKLGDA